MTGLGTPLKCLLNCTPGVEGARLTEAEDEPHSAVEVDATDDEIVHDQYRFDCDPLDGTGVPPPPPDRRRHGQVCHKQREGERRQ